MTNDAIYDGIETLDIIFKSRLNVSKNSMAYSDTLTSVFFKNDISSYIILFMS